MTISLSRIDIACGSDVTTDSKSVAISDTSKLDQQFSTLLEQSKESFPAPDWSLDDSADKDASSNNNDTTADDQEIYAIIASQTTVQIDTMQMRSATEDSDTINSSEDYVGLLLEKDSSLMENSNIKSKIYNDYFCKDDNIGSEKEVISNGKQNNNKFIILPLTNNLSGAHMYSDIVDKANFSKKNNDIENGGFLNTKIDVEPAIIGNILNTNFNRNINISIVGNVSLNEMPVISEKNLCDYKDNEIKQDVLKQDFSDTGNNIPLDMHEPEKLHFHSALKIDTTSVHNDILFDRSQENAIMTPSKDGNSADKDITNTNIINNHSLPRESKNNYEIFTSKNYNIPYLREELRPLYFVGKPTGDNNKNISNDIYGKEKIDNYSSRQNFIYTKPANLPSTLNMVVSTSDKSSVHVQIIRSEDNLSALSLQGTDEATTEALKQTRHELINHLDTAGIQSVNVKITVLPPDTGNITGDQGNFNNGYGSDSYSGQQNQQNNHQQGRSSQMDNFVESSASSMHSETEASKMIENVTSSNYPSPTGLIRHGINISV
ncbi:hypothetical protein PT277_10060 [Acetobacteraceae bacterium ESL0709]|nr:hypothetical protein [Acetobacteraceae bacterium ESL0697]MDF7679025.1 hypothetical protein [Acetobacteraceae bacterium ESL0709]